MIFPVEILEQTSGTRVLRNINRQQIYILDKAGTRASQVR